MGTTYLAVAGASIYPLLDVWIEYRHHGWMGVRKHWRERLKYGFVIAVAWWSVLFLYHLIYRVPHEIGMRAGAAQPPPYKPFPPGPPGFAPEGPKALSPPSSRSPKFDNVAEAIWFGVNAESTTALLEQFRAVDPKLLQFYKAHGSVNTIDNLPSQYYETAWRTTFGSVLVCDPEKGVGSAMTFVFSHHPYIYLLITNSPSGGACIVGASVSTPPMTGGAGFALTGDGFSPRHAYILDLPIWNDTFSIRFFVSAGELRALSQGYSPLWRSFAINDPDETLQLEINRKGGAPWLPLAHLNELLPRRVTLRTDLLYGGPQIVRDYRLASNTPRQVSRGDGTSTWAFTWKRTHYGEQRSIFGGPN
jgi:hypothetical protein